MSHVFISLICATFACGLGLSGAVEAGGLNPQNAGARISAAINARDMKAFVALYAPGAVIHNSTGTVPAEALVQVVAQTLKAVPDLKIGLKNIEVSGDQVLAIEVASGVHSGPESFLNTPPSGKRVSFTVLHALTVRNGQIVEQYSQADFKGTLDRIRLGLPSPTVEEALAELSSADQVAWQQPCDSTQTLTSLWVRLRYFMERKAQMAGPFFEATVSPNLRLTYSGGLNSPREKMIENVEAVGKISKASSVRQLKTIFSGKRFLGKFGQVEVLYSNPSREMGLPPTTVDKPIRFFEMQFVGVCKDQVVRQYSHLDIFGMLGQLFALEAPTQPGSPYAEPVAIEPAEAPLSLAISFLNHFQAKTFLQVRPLLTDDFHHHSPWDDSYGADFFLKDYIAKFGTLDWTYQLNATLEDEEVALTQYTSRSGGQQIELIEVFTLLNKKIRSAWVSPL